MITIPNNHKQKRNEIQRHIKEFKAKGGKIERIKGVKINPGKRVEIPGQWGE